MHQSEIACVIQRAVILTKSVLLPGTLRPLRTMLLPSLMVQPLEAFKPSLQHHRANCSCEIAAVDIAVYAIGTRNWRSCTQALLSSFSKLHQRLFYNNINKHLLQYCPLLPVAPNCISHLLLLSEFPSIWSSYFYFSVDLFIIY
ncbi:hypothetical protein NDU88_002394 [Pleurodeles waltl]|uniref:Uncharacterized protein n=1 Tax=Pleurodeles waltl TaxID=8319 RepID=A0AAV7MMI7_PLEWA|nr:hypothetical protein NDU88_002394 [Pleurodeles waltl]